MLRGANQSMIKGILLDLDGTLIDTNELVIRSYSHTLKSVLNLEISRDEIISYFGEPLKITLGRYCTQEQLSDVVKFYRKFNIDNHDILVKGFPQVQQTLEILKSKGLKIAVVTSKMRDTTLKGLNLCSLQDYIDIIIAFEDTDEHKPTAAPVIKALEKLELKPEEVLMVGDSPNDIESAHQAGVRCAIVEYSLIKRAELEKFQPDFWLKTLMDINDLIK